MLVFYVYKNKKVCNPYRIVDFKYLWYEIIYFLTLLLSPTLIERQLIPVQLKIGL